MKSKGRSTCTNLLEAMHDWTLSIQDKRYVVVVYIVLAKASDVVSHKKLFLRLYSYGIRGNLLSWLQELFSGRTHCIKVGTAMSSLANLLSGVIKAVLLASWCSWLLLMNLLVFCAESQRFAKIRTVKHLATEVTFLLDDWRGRKDIYIYIAMIYFWGWSHNSPFPLPFCPIFPFLQLHIWDFTSRWQSAFAPVPSLLQSLLTL